MSELLNRTIIVINRALCVRFSSEWLSSVLPVMFVHKVLVSNNNFNQQKSETYSSQVDDITFKMSFLIVSQLG